MGSRTQIDPPKMQNLRNFVVIEFHDGIDIVNKHWRIDDNSFFFPTSVKDRVEYFKLINTMVTPGYKNIKYTWLPRSVVKVHSSDDELDEAITKLEMAKLFDGSGNDGNAKGSMPLQERYERCGNVLQFAMSSTSSESESGGPIPDEGNGTCTGASNALPPFCSIPKSSTGNNRPRNNNKLSADGHLSDDVTEKNRCHGKTTRTNNTSASETSDSKTSSDNGFSSKEAKASNVRNTRSADTPSDDNWPDERCLHLIYLYKLSPHLWNPMHGDYKNRTMRRFSLSKICRELKITRKVLDRKLQELICSFQEEYKKVNSKHFGAGGDGGGNDKYVSEWFAYNSFHFIRDIYDSHSLTDENNSEHTIIRKDHNSNHENVISTTSSLTLPLAVSDAPSEIPKVSQSSSDSTIVLKRSGSTNVRAQNKRKKKPDDKTQDASMMRDFFENRTIRDEFILLGAEVMTSVKNLKNAHAQNTVKFKIQTLLYEASQGHYDQPE